MSSFEVLIRPVDEVVHHPNADRLSLVRILGYEAIAAKNEDGSHRFEVGEPICYIPEAAVVPEDVLKEKGYWNAEKDVGMLAGKLGNRVKAIRLRGILSQGLVVKLHYCDKDEAHYLTRNGSALEVKEGQDVAEFLGLTKYEPPVPMGMSGEVCAAYAWAFDYDIENDKNFPGFLDSDEVEATEKLHGTNFRIAYRDDAQHEELFEDGKVGIASKSLGKQGLMFKDNEVNRTKNLYVRTALELDLPRKVRELGEQMSASIDLFGEIYGAGVQDLHYGTTKPEFKAFDVTVNGQFADADTKAKLFEALGVPRVPVLYRGPFDREALEKLRDGTTLVNRKMDANAGACIREGIVVTATGDQTKRDTADGRHRLRPILKMVSPDYLTRKGEATEFE